MKYVKAKGQKLSRFSLGTVQLGMTYGLSPDKPEKNGAFALLDRAMELGVDNLDTANNYGDSEAVIGMWLGRRKSENRALPWTVTKIGPLRHGSYGIVRDDILRQAENCKKTLDVDVIDCLMIHDYNDYAEDRDNVRRVFRELKEQGICRYDAISAYSKHDYGVLADSGFDAAQIPLNIFDWMQIDSGGIEMLRRAGMMVFARSVFLQGLVFRKPEDLDSRMDFCVPYVARFRELCSEFGMTPAVLALSFVFSIQGITTAVLGCRNIQQVESNCELIDKAAPLSGEQLEILHEAFSDTDHRVTNPGLWFNHT